MNTYRFHSEPLQESWLDAYGHLNEAYYLVPFSNTTWIMQDHFGMGWLAGGRMSVKLTNVLWADERIRARGKVQEEVLEGSLRRRSLEVWVEKDDPERTVVSVGSASALV